MTQPPGGARGVRASASLMSGRLTWDGADRPFAT
jgi:hypothetical protein